MNAECWSAEFEPSVLQLRIPHSAFRIPHFQRTDPFMQVVLTFCPKSKHVNSTTTSTQLTQLAEPA